MSSARISFQGVGKKFLRGERHHSLRELLPALTRRFWVTQDGRSNEAEFWAVTDLAFEVTQGDALAIIGPNGAGKSTSLKLATRILQPDTGRVEVNGRVGALIEIAAGFHPDLTGRENIFLQGAIMGMRRKEIVRRLDEIVAFAGVEKFVDTPVKRYSSGMNARLGFSIAAHLEPDVLIIDEVLSVGDMAFQQRCIDRMIRFRKAGVPILFVSHNLQAVAMLCNKAIYLQGSTQASGSTEEVLKIYVASAFANSNHRSSGTVQILDTELRGCSSEARGIAPGTPLVLRTTYAAREPIADLTFGFVVYRASDMLVVYDANCTIEELGITRLEVGQSVAVDYAFRANLTRGSYFLECHVLHNPTGAFLARIAPAGAFNVDESRTWAGVADLDLHPALVRGPADCTGVA